MLQPENPLIVNASDSFEDKGYEDNNKIETTDRNSQKKIYELIFHFKELCNLGKDSEKNEEKKKKKKKNKKKRKSEKAKLKKALCLTLNDSKAFENGICNILQKMENVNINNDVTEKIKKKRKKKRNRKQTQKSTIEDCKSLVIKDDKVTLNLEDFNNLLTINNKVHKYVKTEKQLNNHIHTDFKKNKNTLIIFKNQRKKVLKHKKKMKKLNDLFNESMSLSEALKDIVETENNLPEKKDV